MSMENPIWVDGQKSILEQKSMSMKEEKDTSWEERFDEEFDCVMWWGCYNKDGSQKHGYETDCGDELKSFIRQEREAVEEKVRREFGEHSEAIYSHRREALLREIVEAVKGLSNEVPTGKVCDYENLDLRIYCDGRDDAFTEVQELIKKKI